MTDRVHWFSVFCVLRDLLEICTTLLTSFFKKFFSRNWFRGEPFERFVLPTLHLLFKELEGGKLCVKGINENYRVSYFVWIIDNIFSFILVLRNVWWIIILILNQCYVFVFSKSWFLLLAVCGWHTGTAAHWMGNYHFIITPSFVYFHI